MRVSEVWLVCLGLAVAAPALTASSVALAAVRLPEIRSSAENPVPACVTPERLMKFLSRRNGSLSPRFRDIAAHYKRYGEMWRVRWDYAFFQMAIETNFLTYRAPNGRMGDVDPAQNNFAGIGTTGGGVPGDRFPDVQTGVLAQIQHLVVYSGEMIENPVAPRTQLKQDDILDKSRSLNRPVRFSDLAGRWAADRKYGSSIEWVADAYRGEECRGKAGTPVAEPEVLPWQAPAEPRAEATPTGRETAVSASSPVRTVWSRDEEKEKLPPAKRPPAPEKGVVVKTAKVIPIVPKAPVQADAIAATLAATAPDPAQLFKPAEPPATPETEQAGFALFAPPAALADAKMPGPAATRSIGPAKVADTPRRVTVAGWQDKPAATGAAAAPIVPPKEATVASVAPSDPPAEMVGSSAPPPAEAQVAADASSAAMSTKPDFDPPSGLGVKPSRCVIETASYGGDTTVLVKSPTGTEMHYIAVSVLDGFEENMTQTFIASRPEGGEAIGTFTSKNEALVKARELCPAE
jgi:hypothetical protein